MKVDLARYRDLFIEESRENLDGLSQKLAAGPPWPVNIINEVFRHAHSLKGMAAMMEAVEIRDVAHALESDLHHYRNGDRMLDPGHRDALLAAVDLLAEQIEAYAEGRKAPPLPERLLPEAELTDHRDDLSENTPPIDGSDHAQLSNPTQGDAEAPHEPRVKVLATDLDDLRERLDELNLAVGSATDPDSSGEMVEVALHRTLAITRDITSTALRMRMVRLDGLFHQLARAARTTAASLNKEVKFTCDASDVQLDRSVIESIVEPLVHTVRNAIDHGIETTEVRRRLGKPVPAVVVVSARRDGEWVLLQVTDDGRGFDREALRATARAAGILALPEAGDDELLRLATLPGLSTATAVSEISGRGVGLDVVRTRIEEIGGRLELASTPGEGAKLTLRTPFTVAMQRVLIVRVGGRDFAVPRAGVERVLPWTGHDDAQIDLAAELGLGVSVGIKLTAAESEFLADTVVAERELVVRPLGRPLQRLHCFSAAAITPGGSIALMLDLEAIARRWKARAQATLASMSLA